MIAHVQYAWLSCIYSSAVYFKIKSIKDLIIAFRFIQPKEVWKYRSNISRRRRTQAAREKRQEEKVHCYDSDQSQTVQ